MSEIVVTDLTRFNNRDIVCVAGLDRKDGTCIRPLTAERPHYLPFDYVRKKNIQPGTVLRGRFTSKKEAPPHVEDHLAEITGVDDQVSSDEFEELLIGSAVKTIKKGFGTTPTNRVFAKGKPPAISIITLLLPDPARQILIVEDGFDETKIKAHITDGDGFKLAYTPITDLGFYDHVAALKKADPGLSKLNKFLHGQKSVIMRVGLSRRYQQSEARDGFWVQANGIYSFPNYRTDLRSYD